ncbi:putative serine/threonine-protein kinase roco8 [Monoraphidium neglectum]|uniref:Putative serine/threonine-protein kinase roco8 n=1 Tax=Monoraphidium neglectum TaxID=145388 RepID=A0A0D2MUW9_9CHLO|nr:putative serine/threonine-protein kinase roco8 [Monoraphidium neglectum]KIZ04317.1 putative serine/threonine-protein kinase roco8 [Monoraphidium neglectum]|eukprot:XP_013903336.1 putative serine/threonine-protein kinase roco8 [Monoraphidium neglectum]
MIASKLIHSEMGALQQELSLVASHPLLALPEAAAIVMRHLDADAAAVYVFAEDEPGCAALMAAEGRGASALERTSVVRGDAWSAVRLAQDGEGRLAVPDAPAFQGELPRDLATLHRKAGLRSFLAAAIGPKGSPRGVLVVGRMEARGFDDSDSLLMLDAAATGLLQHVRPAQVAQAVRMMRAIDDAGDPVSAISALLQSTARSMWRATNISMGVRLALVDGGQVTCLVFESRRADAVCRHYMDASQGRSVVLAEDPCADVTVRELGLAHTLVASAVTRRKARFVKDVAAYMQSCPSPARDLFTHASQAVSSLVVVPLLRGGTALGGLYLTQDVPCDFSNIKETVLGLVHALALTIANKLSGQMPLIRMIVQEVELGGPQAAPHPAPASGPRTPLPSDAGAAAGADDHCDSSDSRGARAPRARRASRLSKVSSRQLCAEGMLRVLQQQLHSGRRRSSLLSFQSDLEIHEALGSGGFGRVFRGTWHTAAAAIKVLNARSCDFEAVPDVMEMAVLSSVQHPNIVQVYCCLTNMVAADAGPAGATGVMDSALSACGAAAAAGCGPRYRRVLPGEAVGETYNILVMEYCDGGTLSAAMKTGRWHRILEGGEVAVDVVAVVGVLLDVAHSLQYIHRMHLLHSDVKLDNVLLKSDPSRPSGVTPKLADFGLAKFLKDEGSTVNQSGAGTITHLAPEMFRVGTRITTAVDVYAFGVLMWEFYTRQQPYSGYSRDGVADTVRAGGRPTFPPGTPPSFSQLATACWAHDASARPPMSLVISRLQDIAAGAAAAAPPPADVTKPPPELPAA